MASYIDNVVDDFFWVYMGGMDRARGYTYYTLGGRAGALASATWRFPIWRRINRQMSWLTFKDIYGALFFEVGNAWDDEGFETQGYKRTAGYQLRLNLGSYYAYPTAISFTGAYGMDKAVFINPLFPENSVVNDPRWRYYFTMGFQF
jgi:outer membrane protein assembly factor BamA